MWKGIHFSFKPVHAYRHHCGEKTFIGTNQAAISWRASGDRQISLNASAERAFANFRDKKTSYFTIANFRDKNVVFTHFCNKNLFLQILQQKTVVFYNCMKTSIFTVLQSSQMILVHMLQ